METSRKNLFCVPIKLCIIFTIATIFIVIISLSSCLILYSLSRSNEEESLGLPIPPLYPVTLLEDGFKPSSVKSIDITYADRSVDAAVVRFYEDRCSKSKYQNVLLPIVQLVLKPLWDHRVAFNYYYGDTPVYVAGEDSFITYSISAATDNGIGPVASGCQIQLFVFDDQLKYFEFTESNFIPERGFIDQSGCLPVGADGEVTNSTTIFHLANAGSYFVSAFVKKGIEIQADISVHAVEYNTTGLKVVPCALDEYVKHCTISFSSFQSSPDSVCVWAQSESFMSLNFSSNAINNTRLLIAAVAGGAGAEIVLLALLMLVLVGIHLIRIRLKRQRSTGGENEPLLQKEVITHDHVWDKKNYSIQKIS